MSAGDSCSSWEREKAKPAPAAAQSVATGSGAAAKSALVSAPQKDVLPPPPTETNWGIPPLDPEEQLPPRGITLGIRFFILALLFALAFSFFGEWVIHRVIVGSRLVGVQTLQAVVDK